ncbi:BTAD domain-containing putative transcriptional regulator [Actinomadura atramentaria]|uniref:BTAD domain-containing putative transcriptional regulator n=1 Tax=Actinomadura atramentaria TaxID=1990 RepID=UPI00036A56E4|nr:BTAD domain-containing putative transcriptional regulator [Actinomadura atramentaria]
MRFGVLGETRAWRDDGAEIPLGGPARRALLALLLVRPGDAVPVDRLVAALYDDAPDAEHALQSQVSRLRRALRPDCDVERTAAGYRVAVPPDSVDAARFDALADEGRARLRAGDADAAAELLSAALALWRGDALSDVPESARSADAVRLTERRLAALEDRLEADVLRGAPPVAELRRLVAEHPLRERLHGLLMRALAADGSPAGALEAFADARRVLADELGADPSPDLAALHGELLGGVAPARPPAPLTALLGRADDLAGVTRLLTESRLTTLLGPGGVGKTRLAIEVANRAGGEVVYVPLASIPGSAAPGPRDVDLGGLGVAGAVLAALGLRETGLFGGGLGGLDAAVGRVAAALGGRDALLVLDNCEHVVEDAAAFAVRVLAACSGLRVLATSREPLAVTGEHLWPVRPLPSDAAVRLFAERAAAVRPGLVPDEEQARRICRALDDLPLAVELAAARLRTLDAADLADRLGDRLGRLDVLDRRGRGADARHLTLRAVVGWSWELLPADEQRAAARFSVFAAGATAAAARAVCGADEAVLDSLADKSLLEVSGGRYRMLETVRAYAAERLDASGGTADARAAHAAHALAVARGALPGLLGGGQLARLAELAAEHDDLLAAVRWAIGSGATDVALDLLAALSPYLLIRGRTGTASALAADLLAAVGADRPWREEHVACLLLAAGESLPDPAWAAHRAAAADVLAGPRTGRYPFLPMRWLMAAAGAEDTSLDAAYALLAAERAAADPWARAAAHLTSGYPALAAGEHTAAEREFTDAVELFRAVGDRWGTALALDALAGLAGLRGDTARAVALTDEALLLADALAAVEDRADLLVNRGDYRAADDPAGARADYEEAALVARRAGSPAYVAAARRGLADLALAAGDRTAARRLYEEALAGLDREIRLVDARTGALVGLGRLAALDGDSGRAAGLYRAAVRAAADAGAVFAAARAVAGLAALAADADPSRAARLLGAAAALRGAPEPSGAELAAALTASLGEAAYTAAHAAGAALDQHAALTEALAEDPARTP